MWSVVKTERSGCADPRPKNARAIGARLNQELERQEPERAAGNDDEVLAGDGRSGRREEHLVGLCPEPPRFRFPAEVRFISQGVDQFGDAGDGG